MKAALATAIFVALAAAQTFAPTGAQKFEVASIKRSKPGVIPLGVQPAPGGRRYTGVALPLRSYLYVAYQVRSAQIAGGPGWLDSDLYDLNAEAGRPSSIEELHIMLQNALTERFHLKFHHASKEMAAYVLTVDKDGPKNLTPHTAVPGSDFSLIQKGDSLHFQWSARCASLDFFTWRLSPWLERPILNQTGLKGCFDFDIAFAIDLPNGVQNEQAVDTSNQRIFQALPAQLGLKIEAKKAPVDTLVIDSAERGGDE